MKKSGWLFTAILAIALVFASHATARQTWWEPASPNPGDDITIYYDLNLGHLPAGDVKMHWGTAHSLFK